MSEINLNEIESQLLSGFKPLHVEEMPTQRSIDDARMLTRFILSSNRIELEAFHYEWGGIILDCEDIAGWSPSIYLENKNPGIAELHMAQFNYGDFNIKEEDGIEKLVLAFRECLRGVKHVQREEQ